MVCRPLRAALLPALAAGAVASRGGPGDDGLALVQHSAQVESWAHRSLAGGVPEPSYGLPGDSKAAEVAAVKEDFGKLKKVFDKAMASMPPEYRVGEKAEIISLQGDNIGTWHPCVVKGMGKEPGTYEIFMPGVPEAYSNVPSVPGKYLRKDKPAAGSEAASKAAEAKAEEYAAYLKKARDAPPPAKMQPKMTAEQAKQKDVAGWLFSKGFIPDAKGKFSGKKLTDEVMKNTGEFSSIAKLLQEVYSATPPPLLSEQEEIYKYLNSSEAKAIPKEAMAKLHSTIQNLNPDRPVPEQALELKAETKVATTQDEALWDKLDQLSRQSQQEEEELESEMVINGTWDLGAGQVFSVHNISCKLFLEGKLSSKGQVLVGALQQDGDWVNSTMVNLTGYPMGSLRMRLGEERGTARVMMRDTAAQKDFGQEGWSGEVVARRTAKTNDKFPGKCDFKRYGCSCDANGILKLPPIFFANVGDDVEVFKGDGSGWYPCTVIGKNESTSTYTIFVPENPPNERVFSGLTSDYLRTARTPAPWALKKQEPSAAPAEAARAQLHLAAPNMPRQRTEVRQEEKEVPEAEAKKEDKEQAKKEDKEPAAPAIAKAPAEAEDVKRKQSEEVSSSKAEQTASALAAPAPAVAAAEPAPAEAPEPPTPAAAEPAQAIAAEVPAAPAAEEQKPSVAQPRAAAPAAAQPSMQSQAAPRSRFLAGAVAALLPALCWA